MPRLSRWCIKTGLVYFVLGLLLGIVISFDTVRFSTAGRALWLVYLHLLVVGWITMLIIGVAYWLFPRYDRDQPYGSVTLGWTGYVLLNGGLVLRAVVEPWTAAGGRPFEPAVIVSAAAQLFGILAFVTLLWPRVKGK